eukprot:TRINITY_DN5232_c0_g1_i4.p1 TRINITY_DN5232_c0_g1~~TRINITY_DN5232_c0_g1_i4.p1  ORF type:complete len:141 (+),score=17.33 TRINITY_DN5232_c0_g1_i4:73-495(+)
MSADDKEYLRKHNIHKLLDNLAKDIIERKPDNPQQFVIGWLKVKNTEQESVQKLGLGVLAEWLRDKDDVVVVDVRSEVKGKVIKGSVAIDADQCCKTSTALGKQWKGKPAIVFCGDEPAVNDAATSLSRVVAAPTAVWIL